MRISPILRLYFNVQTVYIVKQMVPDALKIIYGLVIRHNQWFIISITEGEYPSTCIEMLSMKGEPAYQYYMVSEFVKVEDTGERFIQNKYFKLHKAISMAPELRIIKKEESRKKIELVVNNVALAKIKSQTSFLYNICQEEANKAKAILYTIDSEKAIDFILSLGADVKVVGPEDIRDSVRDKIMEMFQNYWDVI